MTDKIGVPHLRRLWSRLALRNNSVGPVEREWMFDKITIHGLGLSLEETFGYLSQDSPDFGEFENWILKKNGGSIASWRIERINATINGAPYSDTIIKALAALDHVKPVLDEEDFRFWEENGYTIVHEAITPQQCEATARAMWEFLRMSPEDPATWYTKSQDHNIMVQFFHHPALQANRDSLRIRKAFAQIWGTADLWCSIDRVSFNPPERAGWTFPGPRLHWDTSLSQPVAFSASGILYLTDTSADQGAFTCVPGFHRRIETWLDSLPAGVDPRTQDLYALGAKPLAGNAGDLIIWHEALPHGSSPNVTSRPRLAQYITLYPATMQSSLEWK